MRGRSAETTTSARLVLADLPDELVETAAALWHEAGLTRPWNDPSADCRRALTSSQSIVLGLFTAPAGKSPSSGETAGLLGSRLLGTVMVGHDGHRGWIYYLAVRTAHRGEGLGARLVHAAEDWLSRRRVPKVMLMIRSENADVREFYDRLGYSEQDVVTLGRFL